MKLSLSILALGIFLSQSVHTAGVEISSQGEKGTAARDGNDGRSGGGGGGRGGDGSDASKAGNAEHSGNIKVWLREEIITEIDEFGETKKIQNIIIEGAITNPDGSLKTQVLESFPWMKEDGYFQIDSSGATGGKGGEGGDGGRGGKGTRGSDATRYSRGTDGGRGGTGGAAGAGSSGGEGGNAGKVEINIKKGDEHLLMALEDLSPGLLTGKVPGGRGGMVGSHGSPGAGGAGGEGGSSHSWTTSHTRSVSDGKGGTRTKFYTRSHHNPGGSTGPRGSSGRSQTAKLDDGKAGANNIWRVTVHQENGEPIVYDRGRYDLRFNEITWVSQINDKIIEPDEEVKVWVELENTGNMPTPENHKIQVNLKQSQGVDTSKVTQEVTIPKSLAPGETYKMQVPLRFKVISQVQRPVIGDAALEKGRIEPYSYLENTNQRIFNRADLTLDFEIRDPVRAPKIQGVRTLLPGEETRFTVKVINEGTLPVGRLAQENPRELERTFEYAFGDGLTPRDFDFYNQDGQLIPLTQVKEEYLRTIERLGPGESAEFSGRIKLKNGAPYKSGTFQSTLKLGDIDNPNHPEAIQKRNFTVQVANEFKPSTRTNLVVVTNNRTTEAEIKAWKKLASLLDLEMEDYNLSLYGNLDLEGDPLGKHSLDKSLFVILNNTYDPLVAQVRPAQLLSPRQALEKLEEKGIRAYVFGKGSSEELKARVEPFPSLEKKGQKRYASASHYGRDHKKGKSGVSKSAQNRDRVIPFKRFKRATPEDLEMAARRLAADLKGQNPNESFLLTTRYYPETKQGVIGFFKKKRIGAIEVYRAPDLNANLLNILDVADEVVHDPSQILGRDNIFGLLKSLSVEQKLRALDQLKMDTRGKKAKLIKEVTLALQDALLSDLVEEQAVIRTSPPLAGASVRELLPRLSAFADYNFESMDEIKARFIIELLSEVEYLAQSQLSLLQKIPLLNFWSSHYQVTKQSKKLINKLLRKDQILAPFQGQIIDGSGRPKKLNPRKVVQKIRKESQEVHRQAFNSQELKGNERRVAEMEKRLRPEGRPQGFKAGSDHRQSNPVVERTKYRQALKARDQLDESLKSLAKKTQAVRDESLGKASSSSSPDVGKITHCLEKNYGALLRSVTP